MTGTISSERKEKTDTTAATADTVPAAIVPRIRGGAARTSNIGVPSNDPSAAATGPVEGVSAEATATGNGKAAQSSTDPSAAPAVAVATSSAQLARTRTPRESTGGVKRPVSAGGARVTSLRASMDGALTSGDGVSSPQSRGAAAVAPSPRQRQKAASGPAASKGRAANIEADVAGGHDGTGKGEVSSFPFPHQFIPSFVNLCAVLQARIAGDESRHCNRFLLFGMGQNVFGEVTERPILLIFSISEILTLYRFLMAYGRTT